MSGPDVPIDPYRSMLRLMVGGSIEAVDALRHWLEEAEASRSELSTDDRPLAGEGDGRRALHVSIALLFASYEVTRRGLSRAVDASTRVARFWGKAFSPARKVLGSSTYAYDADLERWIQAGQAEVRRSRGLARSLAHRAVDRATGSLAASRMVDGLVQAVAGNYLRYLETHPETLEKLIRSHADQYVEYLNRNPQMVQQLVSGQSSGLAEELIDGVRARAVTADGVFEAIVRSILHRPPRDRLPGPSPAVQRRAERATVPSDLKPPGVGEDEAG
jgi:hypothetical protein